MLVQDELNGVDVLCIVEHWLTDSALDLIYFNGFKLITKYSRPTRQHGGVAIFIKAELVVKEVDVLHFCVELHCEFAAIMVSNICIICVYRPYSGDKNVFFDKLEDHLHFLCRSLNCFIICGDINIDWIVESTAKRKMLNVLNMYNMQAMNDLPTRHGKTALDQLMVSKNHVTFSREITSVKYRFLGPRCHRNAI